MGFTQQQLKIQSESSTWVRIVPTASIGQQNPYAPETNSRHQKETRKKKWFTYQPVALHRYQASYFEVYTQKKGGHHRRKRKKKSATNRAVVRKPNTNSSQLAIVRSVLRLAHPCYGRVQCSITQGRVLATGVTKKKRGGFPFRVP